ncbi:MAG: hypothetical protein C4547_03495 [Phycisphaerales bacterium]|nr:MAG: hypothetical protein C4547_03495 [Phycisphaerales bacterium]
MQSLPLTDVLAALPATGVYVNLVKIAGVIVLLLLWSLAIQWVDRDTDRVKTQRETWNLITVSGGIAGFFLLLVPPWTGPLYFAGAGLFLLTGGGSLLWYVVHRNGRVVPGARVLTPDHFKRLLTGGAKAKTLRDTRGQRVRLGRPDGKGIEFETEDPEEQLDYYAAQDFLHDMLWRRASDVDVIRNTERYRVVHRVDGVAAEKPEGLPLDEGERVFRYIKQLAGLNVEERRKPQRGQIHAALVSSEARMDPIEVTTSGTTAGERLRLRVRGSSTVLRLEQLGLAPQRLEALKAAIARRTSMVLLSSPRSSGVTTTAYAIIRAHDAFLNNIHAIEMRPIGTIDNITQHKYEPGESAVAYARMLQTVLRKEPDIVLVGECNDRETAQIASRATDERKIYMCIEAKDSFDALSRYLNFLGDNRLAAGALSAVTCQRLVRVLCTECREAFRPDPDTLKKLNLPADKIERFYRPPTQPLVDKKGNEIICSNCQGTGYRGRTGIFEVLTVSEEIAGLIAEGAPMQKVKSVARRAKMYYLQEEGLFKVIDGTTSLNEVLRCLRENGK